MTRDRDLTIVIVNYKVRDLVRRLLASIYGQVKGVSFEVFLVDNASGDGIAALCAREFPEVRVIQNERNLGFARANDQAIAAARGRHVLLLNPDTELREDAPSAMVAFADAHPDAAVVGCAIRNPDQSIQRSVLAFPTLASQAMILLKLHHLFPRSGALRRYFLPDFEYGKDARVDQVMGAAFLMTRSGLDRLGPLDERFFIWFEEVDWCKRAKDAGFDVWYLSGPSVVHHGAQSFGQVFAPRRQRYYDDSLATYFLKHEGRLAWLLVKALHPLAMALAWCVGLLGMRRKRYA
jgi:hypothetical protein